jgi:hypothetical protein
MSFQARVNKFMYDTEENPFPISFLVLNILLPIFLTCYLFYQEIWGVSNGVIWIGNEIDLAVGFLKFFLTVIIAPAVLIVDMYSLFSGWEPEIGSDTWQVKFFSKALYFTLLIIFILQLIF